MTRVAAIDCGTNTIRLLIAEADRDQSGRPRLEVLRRRNEIVRLGQGVDRTGMLDPDALERTLRVVAAYAADCDELGVAPGEAVRRFVATSATRDASNREDFVAGVRRLLGIKPEVVSGQEEARLEPPAPQCLIGPLCPWPGIDGRGGVRIGGAGVAHGLCDLGGGRLPGSAQRGNPVRIHSPVVVRLPVSQRLSARCLRLPGVQGPGAHLGQCGQRVGPGLIEVDPPVCVGDQEVAPAELGEEA